MRRFRSVGRWGVAALAVAVFAGCASGAPVGPDASPQAEPSGAVALAEITDQRSPAIEYPTIPVPEGVTAEQLDWMLEQLLPAARRSIQVAELSTRDERAAAAWVMESFARPDAVDRPGALEEQFGGTGYSFLVGSRFAPDALPKGSVHVVGQEWTAVNDANVLRVRVLLEHAIPFEDGVAMVVRELRLSADLSKMAMDGSFVPGYGYNVRFLGLDRCAILTEGAARPGDLAEVREKLALLTERGDSGLSVWASADEENGDPVADRAECEAAD